MATENEPVDIVPATLEPDPALPGAIQRGYCRLHRVGLPAQFPTHPRTGMAVLRPAVVATRPGEELLCNGEHSGPHLWPDGDEAGEWEE